MKLSVITATYNSAATVADCLESLKSQSYSNCEHIVIDGGSTDGTLELVRRLGRKDLVYVSEPDAGIYDALNKGIAKATGDVVGFLHSDDVYSGPNVLEAVALRFVNDKALSAVYGDLQYVAKNSPTNVIRHWRSGAYRQNQISWGWMPPHPTLFVKKDLYRQIGGFDPSYQIAGDYDSILKLFSMSGFKVEYIPEVLVKMRSGGASNRSAAAIIDKTREDWQALRRSGFNVWRSAVVLAFKNLRKISQFL